VRVEPFRSWWLCRLARRLVGASRDTAHFACLSDLAFVDAPLVRECCIAVKECFRSDCRITEWTSMEASPRAAYLLPAALIVAGLFYVSTRPGADSPLDSQPSPRVDLDARETPAASAQTGQAKTQLHYPRIDLPILSEPIKIPISSFLAETPAQRRDDEIISNEALHTDALQTGSAVAGELAAETAPIAPAFASQTQVVPSLSDNLASDDPIRPDDVVPHGAPTSQEGGRVDTARQSASEALRRLPPRPLTTEQLQAAAQQALALMERGKRLAEKQAYHSAESEFRTALNVIADTLDSADDGQRRLALDRALVAFDEAGEFHAMQMRRRQVTVTNLVLAHETPVLQQVDCSNVRLRTAMEMYFEYAQEQLAVAMRDAPIGADAYFLLGKLHKSEADSRDGRSLNAPIAMAFHQAAITVEPKHHLAANELGVMLAKHGQWQTAKQLLLQSVQVRPTVEAWVNLSKVHTHMAEHQFAQLALAQAQQMASRRYSSAPQRASSDLNQVVTWLSPRDFAQMAPAHSPAPRGPAAAPPLAVGRNARPAGNQNTVSTAAAPTRSSPWRQPRSN